MPAAFNVSGFTFGELASLGSGFQSFRVSGFQSFKVSVVSEFQGFNASRSMPAAFNVSGFTFGELASLGSVLRVSVFQRVIKL